MEPATLDAAAILRNLRDVFLPAKAAASRKASGTGPLSTPPMRVIKAAASVLQRLQHRFSSCLDTETFQGFDRRRAHAQRVQRAILVPH